ncbi:MAG: response regulator [Chloroflexota bacterium]
MNERKALAVDDASANRDFLERLLGGAKFKVLGAGTGAAALQVIEGLEKLELAVVDWKLPDTTGLDLACTIRQRFPDTYIVIATMYDERSMMEEAFANGCNVFLVKPHGFMELFQRLLTTDIEELCAAPSTIIDQYGPRLFKASTNSVPKVVIPKDSTVTREIAAVKTKTSEAVKVTTASVVAEASKDKAAS